MYSVRLLLFFNEQKKVERKTETEKIVMDLLGTKKKNWTGFKNMFRETKN